MAFANPEDWYRYLKAYDQRPERKALSAQRSRERRVRIRDRMRGLKASLGCVRCGEKRPELLDFHHRDPATKAFQIADAVGVSEARLQAELEKCDVLCISCHRLEHLT